MEGTSLLISLLTFLSSLLFKDEDINASVRIGPSSPSRTDRVSASG